MSMTTLISKLFPLFVTSDKGQVNQVDISSSLGEPSSSSLASSSLSEPSLLLFSDASRKEATVKPPITACHRAIQPTRVFTWHNSSLRVLRRASMCTSCAMMALSVTPPTEDEGAKVDGEIDAGGAVVCVWGYLSLNCAMLHRTVAIAMAHIYEKWEDIGHKTEKWWRSLVIAKGKMSLSRVVVSL